MRDGHYAKHVSSKDLNVNHIMDEVKHVAFHDRVERGEPLSFARLAL